MLIDTRDIRREWVRLHGAEHAGWYGPIEIQLWYGRWNVGSISWGSKDGQSFYAVQCRLPGKKLDLGNFPKEDDAKRKLEAVVDNWLECLTGTRPGFIPEEPKGGFNER